MSSNRSSPRTVFGFPFLVLAVVWWKIPAASSFAFSSLPRPTTMSTTTTTGRQSPPSLDRFRRRRVVSLLDALNKDQEEENDDDDDDDDEEDDEDEYIDTESLGDWRNFRRSLSIVTDDDETVNEPSTLSSQKRSTVQEESSVANNKNNNKNKNNNNNKNNYQVSKENEELLKSQNKELHQEYKSGVWAHETSTPEVGGLMIRLPLEVELFRNHKHSMMGRRLQKQLDGENVEMGVWYARAKSMIEDGMKQIASKADEGGQIDATTLGEDSSELLVMYLDNQETWQEVCLVLEQKGSQAKTLVLNRPMAFKLTENLGKLVLQGAFMTNVAGDTKLVDRRDLMRFMMAFSSECAVYVGGPDNQGDPAIMIHGIKDLPGATEISPGSNIYRGGIDAAVDGVLDGKYSPLEFRFFVGCHEFTDSELDLSVLLGKYQPIACARSIALKQCISLPKPLYHEVLELCGGSMLDLSTLELMKRDDVQFEVVDETDYDEDDDDEIGITTEEFDLEPFDDDDEDTFLQ